jgi:hypothetical protein
MNGEGICSWSDGKIYSGNWLDNMKHGKGCYKWEDGRMYCGDYERD